MSELNDKQRRFVDEYLIDLNATKAAIRAGYSAKTAGSQAFDLLKKPEISAAVQAGKAARSKETGIDAQTVLGELLRLARVDIAGAFYPDGGLKPIHEIPEDVRRAISGVEVLEEFSGRGGDRSQVGWTKKIKFWDKARALEMLAKHLGLLKERVELTGKDGGPVEVAELTPEQARKLILERLGQSGV